MNINKKLKYRLYVRHWVIYIVSKLSYVSRQLSKHMLVYKITIDIFIVETKDINFRSV